MLREHPGWLLQWVKRFVPKPEELFERVHWVFTVYGPLKDAKDDSFTLFNDAIRKIAGTVLENICHGFYSDPHSIPLYYTWGRDKYGLMRYRCIWGTNGIEGGVHQNIIWWIGAFNAGPDFAVEPLHDYVLHHNLKVCLAFSFQMFNFLSLTSRQVGTLNCTGMAYDVHLIFGQETISQSCWIWHLLTSKTCLWKDGSMVTTLFKQQSCLEFYWCLRNNETSWIMPSTPSLWRTQTPATAT